MQTRDFTLRNVSGPQVVAHRGASFDAPENTLAAYSEAIAQGATAAECDVHMSADGRVVVIHDETLERTSDGMGAVADMTFLELSKLDAGSWKDARFAGEPIPELGDLLDAIRGKLILFLEIKAGGGIDEPIAQAIAARGQAGEIVLLSFDHDVLARTQARLPGVPAMALHSYHDGPYPFDIVEDAAANGFQALGLNHVSVTRPLVEHAHERGIALYVWTVNETEDFRRLQSIGVDGIITDKPAWGLSLAASDPMR